MLIEIHMIQNHSPANLNRDDLGAPKTCYFGGVLRSRISSQCLKRSIRMSDEFKALRGGCRTRQLAKLIAKGTKGDHLMKKYKLTPKSWSGLRRFFPTVVLSQRRMQTRARC
jgi:CRISPR system Cascade subunit CasC